MSHVPLNVPLSVKSWLRVKVSFVNDGSVEYSIIQRVSLFTDEDQFIVVLSAPRGLDALSSQIVSPSRG